MRDDSSVTVSSPLLFSCADRESMPGGYSVEAKTHRANEEKRELGSRALPTKPSSASCTIGEAAETEPSFALRYNPPRCWFTPCSRPSSPRLHYWQSMTSDLDSARQDLQAHTISLLQER
ncbi:uncharacterized protein PHACADRAFT_253323 [Phanerochaete carnosa HHB-10118-sp]|uniref:Uncharacterized protein n=1 Tax=Phanerochaete carnosa (strain HHB-10118-sp) TaxID=650164 RepID=K5VXI1_PHACS|nr:uncharacterized protein PHACADRAFT_253323 [Phanerochaete carnosa HHB-10118-sp]EKM56283.1 hypothetical protein PHACADRAFT_253323 [Phanerochaete carnosa HHB-10118-sp]